MGFIIICILTSAFSFIAFASNETTKKDIFSGNPSLLALMDYTGIYDRTEIIKKFGNPDKEERFKINVKQISKVRKKQNLLENEVTLNFCIIAPMVSIWGENQNPHLAFLIAGTCATIQAYSWISAFIKASKIISKL